MQVELLLSLQRISQQFAAAAMSIQQSRSFDAVCIITSGCLAALSDAIIRKLATDQPSEVCSHLMGKTIFNRQLWQNLITEKLIFLKIKLNVRKKGFYFLSVWDILKHLNLIRK